MTDSIVVTNLRMPYTDWAQIKAIAGGFGISVNEFINEIIAKATKAMELGVDFKIAAKRPKTDPIWDWPKMAKQAKPFGTLSSDDKIIYGVS